MEAHREAWIGNAQHRSQVLDLTPSTLNQQNLHCFPSSPHHHGRPEGRAAAGEHPRSKDGRSWPYSRRSRTWYCPPSAPTTEAQRRRSTPAGCSSIGQKNTSALLQSTGKEPKNRKLTLISTPAPLLRHLRPAKPPGRARDRPGRPWSGLRRRDKVGEGRREERPLSGPLVRPFPLEIELGSSFNFPFPNPNHRRDINDG
jgi:hypothetical protein